jgi:photosystem II stability/assembly factor-like uncharacterized protein
MKKVIAILVTILILFSLFQGALRVNVVKAADYSPQDFVGYWINDDSATGSVTKIFISISGDDFQVHAYGRCGGTDCDWGISTTKTSDASDGVFELKWVFSVETVNLTIKLIEKNHIQITVKYHFTDNSGRQDYEVKGTFTRPNVGDFDKVLLELFKNVQKLTFTGAPGIIAVTSQAFPLLISSNDSTPPNQIAIAGSKYGNGFVLGFCHDSFFSDSNIDYFDNKTFASNILNYATKKKILISVSHGEYFNQSNANKFSNYAKSLGFEVQFLNSQISTDSLNSAGALISGSAWKDVSDSEILAIKDFVNNGGILLLGALGWSWVQYHPEKALEDLPANKIGKEFGMKWVDGIIKEADDFIYNDATVFTILYPESLFAMKRNAQWIEVNKGLYGGDVRSFAIDPTNSKVIYAGTYGGVFKSTDSGSNWSEMSTGLTATIVYSLGIDPTNTQVIYTGTRDGVFKSTDSGLNWAKINTGLTTNTKVNSIGIDPTNTQVIYTGTRDGVFKLTNGGTKWIQTSLTDTDVESFAIDPTNTQVIYAGTYGGGVFKSVNGGSSWSKINTGLTNSEVYSLAIDPTNTQVIYAGAELGGLFKSTDGGSNWNKMNIGLTTNTKVNSLGIDPTNTQVIYAGTYGSGVFKSTNGGTNWNKMNSGLANTSIQSLAIDPTNTQVIYAGTYCSGVFKSTDGGLNWSEINTGLTATIIKPLAIDPTNTQVIYAGTYGGGVFKSANGGSSWSEINTGLVDAFVFSLAIDPTNTRVIYSGAGIYGIFKSIDSGTSWSATGLTNTLVTSLAIDPKDTQIIYAGTVDDGIYKSTNGGTNWAKINNGLRIAEVNSLVIDPTNTQVIYAGTDGGLFKSTNGGSNWSEINITGLIVIGGFPQVYSIAIDPNNNNTVYIGVEFGIQKTTNGGSSWNDADSGLTSTYVNSLAIDPMNSQIIYAGTDSGVYCSKDGGLTWSEFGLEGTYISSFAIDPSNSNILYAGTDSFGIYKYTSRYTITASAYNGGSINPSGEIFVNYGDSKTFTIAPNSGYKIKDVIVDGVSVGTVSTYTFDNITADHTIEASFEISYLITSSSDNNGSISPEGDVMVNPNSSQTFTIMPNAGYKIKDVQVDGTSVGAVSTYTFDNVTADHTIEATFEPITYSITASSGIGGSFSPSGIITINYGDSKTFIVTTQSGYNISNVKVDGVSKGSISTYTFTNITSDHTISATFEKEVTETIIILQIGNNSFTVNGVSNNLDSPPVIKNSRTLLPIRAIIESLGGTVSWDATERKVTVSLGSTNLELWIGKSIAKVNGIDTPIDSTNPKVVPEIINSRTMLPLRFVTENLGCDVQWDGTTKTITITYPKS